MAEKKKDDELDSPKRGKKLFILIAALLLLILGVSGYFGAAYFLQLPPFEPPGPTAEEIAAQKAEEEKSQNFCSARSMLSAQRNSLLTSRVKEDYIQVR